jgi:hypothetical protein
MASLARAPAMQADPTPAAADRRKHGTRKSIAGSHDANGGGEMGDRIHQGCTSGSAFGRGHPNRAPTVF